MALVSGIGGGHVNVNYFDRRHSILSEHPAEKCGCINLSLKKKPKKKTKMRLMKERIRQFSIWFFENEDNKEAEHMRRRLERRMRRKKLAAKQGFRYVRWLYGFDVILWIVGAVFTLCSTIKAFGLHTGIYKSKHLYRLLGPSLLFVAVLVLFLATALQHRLKAKHSKRQLNFYVVQKKKKNSKSDTDIKDPDNDSGNEEDIEMTEINKQNGTELEFTSEKETVTWPDGKRLGDILLESKMIGEQPQVGFNNENIKRVVDRRAWAKTKWMRIDTGSEDSLESDVLDLTHTTYMTKGSEKFTPKDSGPRETKAQLPSKLTKASENRIMRFKPLSAGCLKAQSSIKSQTSEISYASTTSESTPLVRK